MSICGDGYQPEERLFLDGCDWYRLLNCANSRLTGEVEPEEHTDKTEKQQKVLELREALLRLATPSARRDVSSSPSARLAPTEVLRPRRRPCTAAQARNSRARL